MFRSTFNSLFGSIPRDDASQPECHCDGELAGVGSLPSDPSSEQVPGPGIHLRGWPGRDLAPGTWGILAWPTRREKPSTPLFGLRLVPSPTIRCCHCTTQGARQTGQTDRQLPAFAGLRFPCRPVRDDPRIHPDMPGCLWVGNTFNLSPTRIALWMMIMYNYQSCTAVSKVVAVLY
ncbi:hypothetical protein M440DRAFT_1260817 [Trichoderma longibrachiatum ATCC 18648]|uniref:Uncharacterized protein n=1 Tax=Trichoderma longibrachiatum ATCC 18648 TaxID=983965 RepID=A0A2T4C2G8_TRILO|nr:hypothetical protein M440DRAFT_1260817 [Trichoderma longibrachiatum ATCC 18648]